MSNNNINFCFFGSSRFSVITLNELAKLGTLPKLIVTTPDKPKGRGLVLSPTPVKEWALANNIPVFNPEKLDEDFVDQLKKQSTDLKIDLFIVASYGKIIPQSILNIPTKQTLNIHPSLLPKYRGASPLQSAILDDCKDTGVTIMLMDEKMDHGPIIAQKTIHIDMWPIYADFQEMMARMGAQLLSEILPKWISGNIVAVPQIHENATFCKKITKENGLIDINSPDKYKNFLKIQAYHEWPQAYFFTEIKGKKIRVKVTSASFKDNELVIERVIPEGSREMSYADFIRGNK